MEFIWECMMLSIMAALGTVFWAIAIGLVALAVSAVSFAIAQMTSGAPKEPPAKPKPYRYEEEKSDKPFME
jgi:hypothetical protein